MEESGKDEMSVLKHLETQFGNISSGWKDSESKYDLSVVCFEDQPYDDIVTYSTLGASEHVLRLGESRAIRQEFIFFAYRNFEKKWIASFLSTLAETIISSQKAILRGDVVGPSAPIILGSPLNSIYSAIPMILDEKFFVYNGSDPDTVMVWIIPIHENEAHYVRFEGWDKFEKLLEQRNPELWDLHRSSII